MSKSPSAVDMNARRVPSDDQTGLRSITALVLRCVCSEPFSRIVNSSKSASRLESNASNPFAPGNAARADDAGTRPATATQTPASRRGTDVLTWACNDLPRERSREVVIRRTQECVGVDVTYTVYFRDSEDGLRCLSRCAASESEVRAWFTRIGIPVVAIRAALA
jgi:hypothetical protein